jgi:hypothetical protein
MSAAWWNDTIAPVMRPAWAAITPSGWKLPVGWGSGVQGGLGKSVPSPVSAWSSPNPGWGSFRSSADCVEFSLSREVLIYNCVKQTIVGIEDIARKNACAAIGTAAR